MAHKPLPNLSSAAKTVAVFDRDEIKYARSGNVAIAYAVLGDGRRDLVFVHGFAGNIEIERESPYIRALHDRLASFSRLITFDRRGVGLSDRLREPATLEARMDDLRAVLDAVNSERAVLFGTFEAASMCLLFAATYAERTLGLMLYNPVAPGTWAPDPVGATTRGLASGGGPVDDQLENVRRGRALDPADGRVLCGRSRVHRRGHAPWRLSASPGAVATIQRMAADVDVRDILGAIRVPTLIANMPAVGEEAEYVAARVSGAQRFEVPGPDYAVPFQLDTLVPQLERFVGTLDVREPETVLAIILFTDIVGSTAKLAELGDARWPDVIERHHALVRRRLSRYRGREVDTVGDGFFAVFDGPIRGNTLRPSNHRITSRARA